MDFLGVGPGELFFILVLMLLVLGPERLPQFARGAGRLVVRVREWIQRSPDAQMVLRAREELELELEELRRSLNEEVQTVRAELESVRGDLAEATKALEESTAEATRALEQSTAEATRAIEDTTAEATRAIEDTTAEAARALDGIDAPDLPDVARTIAPPQAPQSAEAIAEAAGDVEVDAGPIGGRLRAIQERQAAEQATAQGLAEEPPPLAGTPDPEVNGQPVPRLAKPGRPLPQPPAAQADIAADGAAIAALERRVQSLGEEFARQIQALTDEIQALRDARASATADDAPPTPGRVQEEVV